MENVSSTPEIIAGMIQKSPDYQITSQGRKLFGARWNANPIEMKLRGTTEHILAYHLSGSTNVERSQHGRVNGSRMKTGTVTFLPKDSESDWRLGGSMQILHLYLDDELFRNFKEENLDTMCYPAVREFFGIHDPWLDGLFRMLASENMAFYLPEEHVETLLLDQVKSLLVRHLLFHYSCQNAGSDLQQQLGRRVGRLRPSVVQRINHFIDESLHQQIRLQDLAKLACLSKDHFLRAFKETIGQTPYCYVMALRVERARVALRQERETPVAEVARSCGFQNQSHFSATFRRAVGVSPSVYRENA